MGLAKTTEENAHWHDLRAALLRDFPEEAAERPEPAWDRALAGSPDLAPFATAEGLQDGLPSPVTLLEIPSVHPTIREPLTVVLSHRDVVSSVRTRWGEYYEDAFRVAGRYGYDEAFAKALGIVRLWKGDSWALGLSVSPETGEERRRTRATVPIHPFVLETLQKDADDGWAARLFSWRGTHDREFVSRAH